MALSGPFLSAMNRRLKWKTRFLFYARRVHRWLGYATLALAQGVIINGGFDATKFGKISWILCIIQTVFGLAFFVGFEIRHRRSVAKDVPYEAQVITVSGEEFEDRIRNGEQLVLLEDLVLDISEFKADHPGGQFAIEHMVGRDIS